MKNFIIIGNGTAGIAAAQKIRSLDSSAKVTIFSDENYFYYIRPNLIGFLANKYSLEDLQTQADNWYQKNNFKLLKNTKIDLINKTEKYVKTNDNRVFHYDKLIIATGAKPSLPPISGIKQDKIFTLRTIDDAQKIKNFNPKEIIIIGGGLLGIEIAGSLVDSNRKIKIIDIADYPLPRQLNLAQGQKLANLLKEKGIHFYPAEICQNINKDQDKFTITTQKTTEITGDLILVSAGVKARVTLAEKSQLTTDKGIVVNEYLQTSDPDIYAAGDCIQLEDKLWGFVKSAFQQGQIAAENIIQGNTVKYLRTAIDPVLKVSGIDLKEL